MNYKAPIPCKIYTLYFCLDIIKYNNYFDITNMESIELLILTERLIIKQLIEKNPYFLVIIFDRSVQ